MNIDWSFILTVVGIILTIVFGIWGILLVKRKNYPGRVTLVKQSILSLFNNIAKNFDEIAISYKGSPIKENVIYLKGSFINDGEIDIEGSSIERPITLGLKDEFKWIKCKITDQSDELICGTDISPDSKSIEFKFGLFRRKEFFQFEALIETTEKKLTADDLYKSITANHRIPNTQKVTKTELLTEDQMTRKKNRMKSISINFGVQIVFLVGVMLFQVLYLKKTEIHYFHDNKEYKATAKDDKTVELEEIVTGDESVLSIQEFQNGNYEPIIPNRTFGEKVKELKWALPVFILILIVFISLDYWELRKSNRIYEILNKKRNEK